jgi:aromatic-L-amino-acid/L-tryptophan decarboxylase
MNPLDITPDEFRRLAARVIDIAAEYLQSMDIRSIPPDGTGAELERLYRTPLPEAGLPEEALRGLGWHKPSPARISVES